MNLLTHTLAACVTLSLVATAHGQSVAETSDLDFGMSVDAAYYSGTRLLDHHRDIYALYAQPKVKWNAPGGGSFRAQALMQQLSTANARADRRRFDTTLQEAYWRDSRDAWSYSIGRQRIAWGRADAINPTDNLSPRDFTRLSFEDGELRDGRDLLQVAWSNDTHRVSAYLAGRTEGHRVPMTLPPGISIKPLGRDHQPTLALRWDGSFPGIDASVSWLEGTDLVPDLSPDLVGGIAQTQHRQRVLGADMALTAGAVVWRAEAAYMLTPAAADNPWRKHDQLSIVAGPEWSSGRWSLGGQLLWRHVPQWRSPDRLAAPPMLQELAWQQLILSQQERSTQSGFTWRLAWRDEGQGSWLEASGLWISQTRSGLTRWRAQTSGTGALQGWTFSAGIERPFGGERSFFGTLAANRLATVQARLTF